MFIFQCLLVRSLIDSSISDPSVHRASDYYIRVVSIFFEKKVVAIFANQGVSQVSTTPGAKLPPESTKQVVHLELRISQQIFEKMWNDAISNIRDLWEDDSWKKTLSENSRGTVPLILCKVSSTPFWLETCSVGWLCVCVSWWKLEREMGDVGVGELQYCVYVRVYTLQFKDK
jgi:hypothetical protein